MFAKTKRVKTETFSVSELYEDSMTPNSTKKHYSLKTETVTAKINVLDSRSVHLLRIYLKICIFPVSA